MERAGDKKNETSASTWRKFDKDSRRDGVSTARRGAREPRWVSNRRARLHRRCIVRKKLYQSRPRARLPVFPRGPRRLKIGDQHATGRSS